MTKRKPLPRHAAQALDDAKMELADAARESQKLLRAETLTREELYRRLGLLNNHLLRAQIRLDEIRTV